MPVSATNVVQLVVGSFDATGTIDQTDWGLQSTPDDITTFASPLFRQFANGLKSVEVSLGGFNDFAAGAWDEYARTAFGTSQVMQLAFNGATAGTGAIVAQGLLASSQNLAASVGNAPRISPAVTGNGTAIAEGLITQASATNITATGNTTAVQVGALTSTQTIVAAISVLNYSGTGTVTFQLASSATAGGAYTARGTAGAALNAKGGQWLSASGLTVTDTWWRLNVTASLSPVATVLATIAIVTP